MSIQLSALQKVRCRFLRRQGGTPAAGVVATLSLGFGEGSARRKVPVGTLCSDHTGYMSFDLGPLIARGLGSVAGLWLSAPGRLEKDLDLLASLMRSDGRPEEPDGEKGERPALSFVGRETHEGPGGGAAGGPVCIVFPVYVADAPAAAAAAANCSPALLPAIQSPDDCDYRASPYSLLSPAAATLGDGCCEKMVPATLALQEHRFYKVVMRHGDKGELPNTAVQPVRVTEAPVGRNHGLRFAEVLAYRQSWFALGHALGEIKYSLALAPGEATEIAVIDWSRSDSVARSDAVYATEYMDHALKRDRSIEETVDAALREQQGGSSFMAGTSGQATIPLQYVTMTFNHAIGGSVSNSWGTRDLEADTLQELHDGVRQASAYTRSLNSTVVVQAAQSERNLLQTRKVANHNHCHALTIQYYEVLRHYRVSTRFAGRRKAVLVPYEPFVFTAPLALRLRSILERALLDDRVAAGFDALVRMRIGSAAYGTAPPPPPSPTPAPPASSTTMQSSSLKLYGVQGEGVGTGIQLKRGDAFTIDASGQIIFGIGAGIQGPNGRADLAAQDSAFIAKGLRQFSLIYRIGAQGAWRQGGSFAQGTADADGELVLGANDEANWFADNHGGGNDYWSVTVRYPVRTAAPPPQPVQPPAAPPTDTTRPTEAGDRLLAEQLLQHLNGSQGHYNGCVWVMQSPVDRRMYLEAALANNRAVLDAIDDTPLALCGNSVAYGYDGPMPDWQATREEDPVQPLEDIVTLPTRGLFAEAQLGHCQACEERDPTRRWDWREMTVEEPPAIEGVTPGLRGETPSVTPANLPANVIQITQPPQAPDPTGMAAALKLLGTPDIFRDMSGLDQVSSLLQKLIEEASDGNSKALAMKAQQALNQSRSSPATHGAAEGADKTRSSADESDAGKQVDRLKALEYARDHGLIDDEQQAGAAQSVLGGEPLPAASGGATGEDAQPVVLTSTTRVAAQMLQPDEQGDIDLGDTVMRHLLAVTQPADGLCVDASATYFGQAMKKLGVDTARVQTASASFEVPVIVTAGGNRLSTGAFMALWYSNTAWSGWSRLPARCRGAGAPGALLYADMIDQRTLLTSATGWPAGMRPGAHLQLWGSQAEYQELRDDGTQPASIGHSCIFAAYDVNDATRIVVYDQVGIERSLRFGALGMRFVIAGNLARARVVSG